MHPVIVWLLQHSLHIQDTYILTSLYYSLFVSPTHATQDNITTTQDTHSYYTSTYYPPGSAAASDLWLELSGREGSGVVVDDNLTESVLSELHRYYEVHVHILCVSDHDFSLYCTVIHAHVHVRV